MPVDEQTAARTAELFATLSDPHRVRILSALIEDKELNVGALVECLGMSESAISHQLRGLRQMRIVRARKVGRQVFYSVDDDHVARLFQQGIDHARNTNNQIEIFWLLAAGIGLRAWPVNQNLIVGSGCE